MTPATAVIPQTISGTTPQDGRAELIQLTTAKTTTASAVERAPAGSVTRRGAEHALDDTQYGYYHTHYGY